MVIRILDSKIYYFESGPIDFDGYDPTQKVRVSIYDSEDILLKRVQLKISRLIYDAEVENEEIYGLLLYDPLKNQMKIRLVLN